MTSTTASGSPPSSRDLTDADLRVLEAAGISASDAERQIELLRGGMRRPKLLRPCTEGDGIEVPDPETFRELGEAYRKACKEGRWVHFVPASGAATRMAASLADPEMLRQMKARPEYGKSALPGLLQDPDAVAGMPKALMPFHRHDGGVRTPVEEHVREAAALADGAEARLHFTISPEHEKEFAREAGRVLGLLRGEGIRAEITHSFQDPSTRTLALDGDGAPFRTADGQLLLRPGGHGSLLRNLENCGGEFAWVRNIDNIPVERVRAGGRDLRRALGGLLQRLALHPSLAPSPDEGRTGVVASRSGERPARVCGMVRNTGEPGGGPFWIKGAGGPLIRIVESAEVDKEDAAQTKIFRAATHFNPVDLACALRDTSGRAFRLEDFTDPSACFIAEKSFEGRALRALEWPGLWNGAMAGWTTHCVEIPLSQFAPVKTVADLLREEHLGS